MFLKHHLQEGDPHFSSIQWLINAVVSIGSFGNCQTQEKSLGSSLFINWIIMVMLFKISMLHFPHL